MNNDKRLIDITWDEFQPLSLPAKIPYCNRNGCPYHVLIAQQFDRAMLDDLGILATKIRRIAKSKAGMLFLSSLLEHKRAMLYFSQPSSRTFLSFHAVAGTFPQAGLRLSGICSAEFLSQPYFD